MPARIATREAPSKAGDLVFELTVTDNLGGKASDQVKVIVTR